MQFDSKKPTAMMLGRWQPWHDGHQQLFLETLKRTGQVVIMVRDTGGTDDSNPFDFGTVKKNIDAALTNYVDQYIIMYVPNITNIVYGRKVGYEIERIDLPSEIEAISATKIREKLKHEEND